MSFFLLVASHFAFAADHTISVGTASSKSSSDEKCYFDVLDVTGGVTLTKVEAYVDESDSSSASLQLFLLTLSGAGKWSSATLGGSVSISGTTDKYYASSTLNSKLTAGTTYAIGYCSHNAVQAWYSKTDKNDPDLGFATYSGWMTFGYSDNIPTTFEAGDGVVLKLTVTGSDSDRDGFDSFDDCDDTDADTYPGAKEKWYDGVDEACDGGNDYDQDADSYDNDVDCDDKDADVHPGASDKIYDGVDSNCDGLSDYDKDQDGEDAEKYDGPDCDDENPDINTSAKDKWYDGIDSNCDGKSDYDQDGDGHEAQSVGGDDCDDTDKTVAKDCSGNTDTGSPKGGNGGNKNNNDSTESKGCCGGGSAMLFTTLLWTAVGRKRKETVQA